MVVIVYVDDVLLAASSEEESKPFFEAPCAKFKCKETGFIRGSRQLDLLGRIIVGDKLGLSIGFGELVQGPVTPTASQ